MIPSIEPSEVGVTGLLWLFLSYGYVLYYASNMISEGSELLLLVPSMAGLVGGVVLPLCRVVPDGMIILFSGLGDIETAQEMLSVGVGALAGSTIMLLTVPLALSVMAGRVDLDADGNPAYLKKPKLSYGENLCQGLTKSGVAINEVVRHGSIVMMLTTIPYFLIQVPTMFINDENEEVATTENWWAASAFLICLIGLVVYMRLQLTSSREGEDREKRMAVVRKLLQKGKVSLSGAVASELRRTEDRDNASAVGYKPMADNGSHPLFPSDEIAAYLKDILGDAFITYDSDRNGMLDRNESFMFFRDFHEHISEEEMDKLFRRYDIDSSGGIDLHEFIGLAYALIKIQDAKESNKHIAACNTRTALAESAFSEIEEEELPEEFTALPPDQQQAAIKKRAFIMLTIGTLMVIMFSDPMVDVMQEIAVRIHMSSFYVSFILAPLASNASEVISSHYHAAKKTSKTITICLSAQEGAACMNNTFCLSIFMGLVFFRGLDWHYTAETIAIILVEMFVGIMLQQSKVLTCGRALLIAMAFPLSLVLVAALEAMGFD